VARPREAAGLRERCIGTAVHRVLEGLAGRASLPAQSGAAERHLARLSLAQAGLPAAAQAEALAEVIEHIDRTLADREGRWVLAAHPESASERSLTALDDAGELQQLVLDRYFRDPATGEHWIVDYKTSRPLPGEPVDAFETREAAVHAPQLARYREALAAMVGGPVHCALYFTALGRLRRQP
jgi:ATP-dependent exoDNAse (exonuclease V) beta subunit